MIKMHLLSTSDGHNKKKNTCNLQMREMLVAATLVDVAIILLVQLGPRGVSAETTLGTVPSIVIPAVPVALPLVVKVTPSVGAKLLASEHGAIVTHLPALDEIAAMRILCSVFSAVTRRGC